MLLTFAEGEIIKQNTEIFYFASIYRYIFIININGSEYNGDKI